MSAGLSTPLHLAASLLAFFAAVGLAVALAGGLRRHSRSALVAIAGAVLLAAGHALSGALVPDAGELAAWARAVGLVLAALGLRGPEIAGLAAAARGPALIVPIVSLPAAVVAAAGGGMALIRLVAAGRDTAIVGIGLGLWGAAEPLSRRSPTAGALLVLAGSGLLGAWLWKVSARRLLAKFVTAFVATLLAVVVFVAAVVSGIGSTQLVEEELRRLDDLSERLAGQIGGAWPNEAIAAARPLRNSGELLLSIPAEDTERLRDISDLSFRQQDFFALLGPQGRVVSAYSEDPDLLSGAFTFALTGARAVDRVIDGRAEDGGLVTVGGRIVALGVVRLTAADARPEDPAVGVLVTGRVVDEVWAAQTASSLGVGVLVEVAEALSVRSPQLPPGAEGDPEGLLAALEAETTGIVQRGGRAAYAAAESIRDPDSGAALGRVVTVSADDVFAQVERDQTSRLFLLALLGALLAGLVVAALTRRLVAPIRRLTTAAAAVRAGRLDTQAEVGSADEVGTLGRTFNDMTASLAAQSAELVEAAAVQSRLRARLEALTASMGDALVAVDADGEVITFNPAAERLVGHDADAAIGRPLDRVLRLAGEGPLSAMIGPPDSEESRGLQVLLRGPSARPVPVAATAAPVRDGDGKVLGRVLVLRDMTREAEVERMKGEFLANVSHELRTPLTPIKGYADILARRDVAPEKSRRYARQILESTALLERIVGMIVDFAALDSGQLQLSREPVRLGDLVGETLDDWRELHPQRRFTRRVAKTLPPVAADARMLRRALDELLDNAVKFSPGGEPVSVAAALEEAYGRARIRLTVRDRGVGIDPETAAEVFSDFYQVDASETRHFGGLGLGLALVRRIVDGLGGDAEVASVPGEGTAVHLLLPCADAPRVRRARR